MKKKKITGSIGSQLFQSTKNLLNNRHESSAAQALTHGPLPPLNSLTHRQPGGVGAHCGAVPSGGATTVGWIPLFARAAHTVLSLVGFGHHEAILCLQRSVKSFRQGSWQMPIWQTISELFMIVLECNVCFTEIFSFFVVVVNIYLSVFRFTLKPINC